MAPVMQNLKLHLKNPSRQATHLTASCCIPLLLTFCLTSASTFLEVNAQAKPVPFVSGGKRLQAPTSGGTVVAPARTSLDYSDIGGAVYATGIGDVVVTVHHVKDFISDGFHPYDMTVSMQSGDKSIPLGGNYDKRTSNLGKLPAGEIVLSAKCLSGDGVVASGSGLRNADQKPRTRVREVKPGVVEVYFESTIREGKISDRTEQHWYNDMKLTFTGGVTADQGLVAILETLKSSDPKSREAARVSLKQGWPALAKQMNVR